MKIFFDQGVPKPLRSYLATHEVQRAFQRGWERKKNSELLALAEAAGFNMLVTTDQNLRYQQSLHDLKLAVFIFPKFHPVSLARA